MTRFYFLITGLMWLASAAFGQNKIIYLIPDASGSDEAKNAFNNSLDHALELFNQSEQAMLFAEGFLKQYVAFNPAEAELVIDSLRRSTDGVRVNFMENVSVRSFQAALDQFERNSGLDLLDEDEPNVVLHVLVAGNFESFLKDNSWIQHWFQPVFRQNGWPSPLRDDESWPTWLVVNHLFDVNSLGEKVKMP